MAKSPKYLIPYLLNVVSLVAAMPWLIFTGILNIPGMLAALFTPPPGFGVISPMLVDYTINIVLLVAIQLVPLIGLVFAAVKLFSPSTIGNIGSIMLVSHSLWIKSFVPLVGLLIAQAMLGEDIIGSLLGQPAQTAFYVASPIVAGIALLAGKPVGLLSKEEAQKKID